MDDILTRLQRVRMDTQMLGEKFVDPLREMSAWHTVYKH